MSALATLSSFGTASEVHNFCPSSSYFTTLRRHMPTGEKFGRGEGKVDRLNSILITAAVRWSDCVFMC